MRTLFCVAVVTALLVSGVAVAGLVQTDTGDTAPPTDTDFTDRPVVLDQYNGVLPLQMVRLIMKADATGWMGVENLSTKSGTTATLNFKCLMELTKADNTLLLAANADAAPEVATLGVFDGTIDWAGTSGYKWDPVLGTATVTLDLFGGDMSDFIGAGQITLYVDATGTSSASGGGNLAIIFSQQALATVTVEYYAEEGNIPEPGAFVLLAGGLLGLVRRKRS